MPLVDVPQEVGSMTFASGSHLLGSGGQIAISDESEAVFNQMIADKNLPLHNYGALQAGDATWHYGWTLHGAPGNPTQNTREVMTIIYYADGARVSEPQHESHRLDLSQWLPGLSPGDLAQSALNPLV